VAVVGTRHASEAGRLTATRIGAAIARAGAVVVSGLAVGIDGAAHAAVVEQGGVTVAVLGGGLRRLYPAAHRRLAQAIVDGGGALVSEFPPDTVPVAGLFPRRNRLISGLSDATVVVEAGHHSGALITAEWALEQGRDCFVVPGAIDNDLAAGCLELLRGYTGQARVVAGITELIEDLEIAEAVDSAGAPVGPSLAAILTGLDDVPRAIARELLAGHTTADELVGRTGLPIAAILAALTLLEARRLVVSAYGRYRPAGPLAIAGDGHDRRRSRHPKGLTGVR
jgi:DNA processing protein